MHGEHWALFHSARSEVEAVVNLVQRSRFGPAPFASADVADKEAAVEQWLGEEDNEDVQAATVDEIK